MTKREKGLRLYAEVLLKVRVRRRKLAQYMSNALAYGLVSSLDTPANHRLCGELLALEGLLWQGDLEEDET